MNYHVLLIVEIKSSSYKGIKANFAGMNIAKTPAVIQLIPINAKRNDGVKISPMISTIPAIIHINHIFSIIFSLLK